MTNLINKHLRLKIPPHRKPIFNLNQLSTAFTKSNLSQKYLLKDKTTTKMLGLPYIFIYFLKNLMLN